MAGLFPWPGANVGVVSSRFRLLYTRRNTSSVPRSRMLGGPQGQSERAGGNEPLWVSLIWSKSDYRKPVALFTIFISIRNGKRRLWKCHLFPPCLLTPSLSLRQEVLCLLFLFHLQWTHILTFFPARHSWSILRPLLPAEPTTLSRYAASCLMRKFWHPACSFSRFSSLPPEKFWDTNHKLDL